MAWFCTMTACLYPLSHTNHAPKTTQYKYNANRYEYVMLLYIRVSVVLIYSLCRKEREKVDITLDSRVLCLPELRKFSSNELF